MLIFIWGDGMQDALTFLVRQSRKMEGRVSNTNKDKLIKDMNKYGKDYGLGKLSKNASIEQVRNTRNYFLEKLSQDIVTLAVQEGNTVISEIYSRDLRKSEDKEIKRFGEFAPKLAKAKRQSDSHLTAEEKAFLERGNKNIKGYGNEDIITEFEKTKSIKGALDLIAEVQNQDPKQVYYDKNIETFARVFQKVESVREEDITKLSNKLRELEFEDLTETTNYLLQTLEIYGSPDNATGKHGDEETELANARLDDIMIRTGVKDTGKQKVKKVYNKYKSK